MFNSETVAAESTAIPSDAAEPKVPCRFMPKFSLENLHVNYPSPAELEGPPLQREREGVPRATFTVEAHLNIETILDEVRNVAHGSPKISRQSTRRHRPAPKGPKKTSLTPL